MLQVQLDLNPSQLIPANAERDACKTSQLDLYLHLEPICWHGKINFRRRFGWRLAIYIVRSCGCSAGAQNFSFSLQLRILPHKLTENGNVKMFPFSLKEPQTWLQVIPHTRAIHTSRFFGRKSFKTTREPTRLLDGQTFAQGTELAAMTILSRSDDLLKIY